MPDGICLFLTSLSVIICRSIQVAVVSIILFFFTAENFPLFFLIHSFFGGHLVCFHVLAIVNSAVINTGLHISFQIRVFSGCMPRSRVAGSYCNSSFSFVRNFHAAFYSGCTNLYSHQQYRDFPFLYTSSAFVTYRL